MQYDVVIGLEVHAELKTNSKCFCSCKNESLNTPNTNCCPVCVGLPGALPTLNKKAVELTIKAGLALGCKINKTAIFERKNYFYPDLSKAYQISQLEKPICIDGSLEVKGKKIRINRIHLEEDAGKLIHSTDGTTLIDYNRAGIPLMELVTEPDLTSVEDVVEFLTALRQIYIYSGVADCFIEKGQMRADVNISLKPKGSSKLGTRTEMKNLTGFRAIARAVKYEIERQKDLLDAGEQIQQETLKWNDDKGENYTLRTKEDSQDYRYFPEPDLLAVDIDEEFIKKTKQLMPKLPNELKHIYINDYMLSEYDTDVLLQFKHVNDFFLKCVNIYNKPKTVANWIITDIMAKIKTDSGASSILISPKNMCYLMKNVDEKKINKINAKKIMNLIWNTDKSAEDETKRLNYIIDMSDELVDNLINSIFTNFAHVVDQYKAEEDPKIINYLVGQVMREAKGKANASEVMEKIKNKLK